MHIATKTGDKGKTSLLYGGRVDKDNCRIEACGIIDELTSFLGLGRSLVKGRAQKRLIRSAQERLFLMSSELACPKSSVRKLKRRIAQGDITELERNIDKLEAAGRKRRGGFVTPGKNRLSATLHIARTVSRRAERRVMTLKKKRLLSNRFIIIYLNRLSDLLYLLARSHE